MDLKKIPFRRVMKDPSNVLLTFRGLVVSFNLGDYVHGMRYKIDLSAEDRVLFQDYIDRCSAVAQFDPLWDGWSSVWKSSYNKASRKYSNISDQDMRNLCLSFRKIHSNSEPGGNYRTCANRVQKLVHEQTPEHVEQIKSQYLVPIQSAVKSLNSKNFEYFFQKELDPSYPEKLLDATICGYSPEEIISIMFYGGYIHRDRKQKEFQRLAANPELFQQVRFKFIGQTRAQALTYMIFAEFILVLARGNGLKRPRTRDQHQTEFVFEN